jgi:hypothetical protein
MADSKIFISYARRDGKSLANRLQEDLIAAGYTVWLDTSEIEGGASWSLSIENAIDGSAVTLALLSEGSYRSEICRAEHLRSLRKGKRVIPLMVQSSTERPLYLEHLHYLDFSPDTEYRAVFDDLLKAITDDKHIPLPAIYMRTRVSTNAPPSPPHFLERRDVLDRLRAAVTSDTSDRRIGITAIQGMGGIGKTVMAAALCRDKVVQDAYPDGIVWITMGQNPGSLLTRLRYLLEALGEAVGSNDDQETMVGKLRTVLPKKAALIVLDDVWDIDAIQPFIVEDAPAARLLFTTRDASLVTALGAEEHCLDVLPDDQAQQLLAEWTKSRPADLPPDAGEIAQQCGNLPLALSLCGAVVRDGDTWSSVLAALREADLTYVDHPHGSVMKSIKISLDALERDNPAFVRHYLELGVFPDDATLPEEAVLTLWLHTNGLNERSARKLVTTLGRRALLRVIGEQPHRALELHDIQHLYVRGALSNLRGAHEELLEAYRAKCPSGWASGPNDGYFFDHLAYHLREAGRQAELCDLLTASPDWINAKFAACVGDTSYAADLDQVIADFADPLDAAQVLVLVRLYSARQVVHTRVSIYNDTDLQTLVWLGREREALSHARLRSEPHEQFASLMAIYETQKLHDRADMLLLDSLLPLVHSIQDAYGRAVALRVLAAALAQVGDGQAVVVFREAGEVARTIQDAYGRAVALRVLAAALAQAGDGQAVVVFREAGEVTRMIPKEWERAEALRELAIALTQAGDEQASVIFYEASEAAHDIRDASRRAEALRALASALAETGQFDAASEVARAIQNEYQRAKALRDLAAALAQAGDGRAAERFDEAGEATRTIQDTKLRVHALRDLASALVQAGDGQAAVVFREADEMARSIQNEYQRAFALRVLAAALAKTGQFDAAGEVARATQDTKLRVHALRDLAAVLAQAGNGQAFVVFQEACEVARTIQDAGSRAHALSALAAALAQAGDGQAGVVFREACEAARTIQVADWRVSALHALAAALAQAGDEQAGMVFREACEAARTIQDAGSRALALSALAAFMTQVGDRQADHVFREAGEVARTIQDAGSRALALCNLAAALAHIGRFDEAGEVARAIQDEYGRAEALVALAVALAQVGHGQLAVVFREAGEAARAIQDAGSRALALSDLAAALAHIGRFDEAGEVARAIPHRGSRTVALRDLAVVLAQAERFDEAGEVARTIQDAGCQAVALRNLAAALAQAKRFDEACEVARTIQDAGSRAHALSALAAALAQAGDGQAGVVFREAGEVARSIQNEYRRAEALRELASALVQAGDEQAAVTFREACGAARASQHAGALSALAAALVQAEQFDEAGEVVRAIQDARSREAALRDLAVALAQAGRFAEAFATLGQCKPDEFIQKVAEWNKPFDILRTGLSIPILQEVLRIVGWERPDWQRIYTLLATGESET